jgi:hypothetical protein
LPSPIFSYFLDQIMAPAIGAVQEQLVQLLEVAQDKLAQRQPGDTPNIPIVLAQGLHSTLPVPIASMSINDVHKWCKALQAEIMYVAPSDVPNFHVPNLP